MPLSREGGPTLSMKEKENINLIWKPANGDEYRFVNMSIELSCMRRRWKNEKAKSKKRDRRRRSVCAVRKALDGPAVVEPRCARRPYAVEVGPRCALVRPSAVEGAMQGGGGIAQNRQLARRHGARVCLWIQCSPVCRSEKSAPCFILCIHVYGCMAETQRNVSRDQS